MKKNIKLAAIITGLAVLTITNPVEAKQYTDVPQGSWYYNVVDKLSNQGVINGYLDGTFKPQNHVTKAEYLTLLNNKIGEKQDNTGEKWYSNTINYLQNKGVEIGEDIEKPINRKEVARLTVEIIEKVTNKQLEAVENNLKGTDENVNKLYNKGVIKGDEKGNYNPNQYLTRAETSQIIENLDKLNNTNNTEVQQNEPKLTPAGVIDVTWGKGHEVHDLNNPHRNYSFKEGDTIIKKDGTQVTLKRGPSGVLGEGQGLDLWSGIELKGGVFQEGVLGLGDTEYLGEPYIINKLTGEGHFQNDWGRILSNTYPKYKGTKDGEISKDKNWKWSVAHDDWLSLTC